MTLTSLTRLVTLAGIFALGTASGAAAQTTPAQPEDAPDQGQDAEPAQPGMMQPGMMGHMGPGMMDRMRMRGHMMKIMFAIADADGDGAMSFEEITTIHKRIFDRVDASKDGKVTPEEIQEFMRE